MMKRFFRNIAIFGAFPVLAVCTIVFIYLYKIKEVENIQSEIALSNNTLIMGDSEMQRISPDFFHDSVYNFASISEHYYFTLLKLKKILSHKNNKVKTIILGVSIHNFSPLYRRAFDINELEGISSFSRYLPYIKFQGSEFMKDAEKSRLIKPFINSTLTGEFMKWGYHKSYHENPDKELVLTTFKLHYSNGKKGDELSQEKSLDEIVKLCESNQIRLIFVSAPVHTLYKQSVESKYYKILAKNIASHPDVEYLNYLGDNTSPYFMSDGNHLNIKGSKVFTLDIIERLKTRTHDTVYTK